MTTCVCGNDISGFCPGVAQCEAAMIESHRIDHNYLPQQFSGIESLLDGIRDVVRRCDFTLGEEVALFEREFAAMVGTKHAIGVGNGTDALFLSLKALGVSGGNVITTPYSFYATSAVIAHAGAVPNYVDVCADFNMDASKIEAAIDKDTVGILPVHWAGRPCDMDAINEIAKRRGLWVLEDCAHAPNSLYRGRKCGNLGDIAAFSLHPLKNVNVWGDGGIITTNDDAKAEWLRKARNHGMSDRNTCEFWGWNSRLDTVQAVVALRVLASIEERTEKRRLNAGILNKLLWGIDGVDVVPMQLGSASNYYLYCIHAERRDELQKFLMTNGVDAKVHYPTPLHRQPAFHFGEQEFKIADWCAATTLSLPIHEFLEEEQLLKMGALIRSFYQ